MDVCLYLHVHQPRRLKDFSIFDLGQREDYFDQEQNRKYLERVAEKSYKPTNKILYDLIQETGGEFKVSFSITGSILEQFERYAPEVLNSFKRLADTGSVEFLSETYYHSLASIYSQQEFKRQVKVQHDKLDQLFGVTPRVFRNTELIYNDEIADFVDSLGYEGILTEGADRILDWRSPNFLYHSPGGLPLLLKNYRLSDDIAFRFSEKDWSEWPLDAGKFAKWVSASDKAGEILNLFMDYETFGEHQWEETGIFDFLRHLPREILKDSSNRFVTPSEAIKNHSPKDSLRVPDLVTWADTERDLSAWRGNNLQRSALEKVYSLEEDVLSQSKKLVEDWRHLQTADHFYYMCTKWFEDGDVHKYFSPYDSPYDAYINYMNVLEDLEHRLENSGV